MRLHVNGRIQENLWSTLLRTFSCGFACAVTIEARTKGPSASRYWPRERVALSKPPPSSMATGAVVLAAPGEKPIFEYETIPSRSRRGHERSYNYTPSGRCRSSA